MKYKSTSLSFAAGVMITVSITDLIPESILLLGNNLKNSTTIIISILAAIILHNLSENCSPRASQ